MLLPPAPASLLVRGRGMCPSVVSSSLALCLVACSAIFRFGLGGRSASHNAPPAPFSLFLLCCYVSVPQHFGFFADFLLPFGDKNLPPFNQLQLRSSCLPFRRLQRRRSHTKGIRFTKILSGKLHEKPQPLGLLLHSH